MKYIKAENLRKQYGEGDATVLAVDDVNLQIHAGEFLALMGESGSGKSTLLSMLGILNTPTSGKLFVDTADVYTFGQDERADFRRDSVGFIFQSFHLVPYMTIAENVMLPLAIIKKNRNSKRKMAEEALKKVGLLKKGYRLPSEISGGEQERVAIARAIVNNPPILLADEPTGNLDSKTAKEIMELLGTLNAGGTTIIMVTHSNEYAKYAHTILRLADGRIVN